MLLSSPLDTWNEALQEMLKDSKVISKMKGCSHILPFYYDSHKMERYVREEAEEAKKLWGAK